MRGGMTIRIVGTATSRAGTGLAVDPGPHTLPGIIASASAPPRLHGCGETKAFVRQTDALAIGGRVLDQAELLELFERLEGVAGGHTARPEHSAIALGAWVFRKATISSAGSGCRTLLC
jgi:hypothetical protein